MPVKFTWDKQFIVLDYHKRLYIHVGSLNMFQVDVDDMIVVIERNVGTSYI